MKDWLEKVSAFCEDVVKLDAPSGPAVLSPERLKFYLGAADEELQEFVEATNAGDIGEAADALVDLIYFTLGRLYEMGVPADVVFEDVHTANMKKRRGVKKERRVKHKDDAMKPENWVAPDHSWLAHLSPVSIEAAKLRARKSEDYRAGGTGITTKDYFPFGVLSHAQMIWTKALRIRSVAEQIYKAKVLGKEHTTNFEGLRDSVVDMHNYVNFAAEDMDGGLK
jgi:predicted HAD superfamily Cof-like phosphohydrolase